MEKTNFDGYELIPVAKLDFGGGYDWDEMEIYYIASQKRFFWLSGSGCSCDYLWSDYSTLGSLQNGFREDTINAIRSFISERSDYAKIDGTEAIAKVKNFRIPK